MFEDINLLTTNRRVVFYGAGQYANRFARTYCVEMQKLRLPDYVCDKDERKWGQPFFGTEISPPARLYAEDPANVVVVLATNPFAVLADVRDRLYYYSFMPAMALEMKYCLSGYDPKTIESVRASFADAKSRLVFDTLTDGQAAGQIWFRSIYEFPPYFGNDVVPTLADGEILVDAGAYTGDHIKAFERLNSRYAKVYAFEPYAPHLKAIEHRFAGEPRVLPMRAGLYSENTKMAFDAQNPVGAHVLPRSGGGLKEESVVDVVRLDDAAPDASYIKMDIEGAEIEAIYGAANTIVNGRPKMAICVYHRPSDYIDIPSLVTSLRGDYKLFLRQHSPFNIDTVLYAV